MIDDPHDLIQKQMPTEETMGPAMLKLNERQRRFVCALAIYGGDQRSAYEWAGYETTNENSTHAAASRLANSAAVVDAIREEAYRRLTSSSMLAVSTLVELASFTNEDKKTRKAAADSLLDRVAGFAGKSEQTIIVKDERTTAELIAIIRQHAPRVGLNADQLLGIAGPKSSNGDSGGMSASGDAENKALISAIDAEFEEVDDFLDGCV